MHFHTVPCGRKKTLEKQAKVAIEELGNDAVDVLRKAALMARAATSTSASALNNARYRLESALTNVIKPLDLSEPFEEVYIDNAKSAIDAWIKELERSV